MIKCVVHDVLDVWLDIVQDLIHLLAVVLRIEQVLLQEVPVSVYSRIDTNYDKTVEFYG